jgi:uncharacterized protein
LELGASGVGMTVGAFVIASVLPDDQQWLRTVKAVAPPVILLWSILVVVLVPMLRARRWRWRLDDVELDLRHGVITDTRTIIPVARIQHVDVRRTLAAQMAGVAAVVVHTAAGTTEIPALTEADAGLVRDRIAGLIRTPDDD